MIRLWIPFYNLDMGLHHQLSKALTRISQLYDPGVDLRAEALLKP